MQPLHTKTRWNLETRKCYFIWVCSYNAVDIALEDFKYQRKNLSETIEFGLRNFLKIRVSVAKIYLMKYWDLISYFL